MSTREIIEEFREEFRHLNEEDKLALLSALWDEVAPIEDRRPLRSEERRFLDERLADINLDPRPDRDWSDAKDELLKRR